MAITTRRQTKATTFEQLYRENYSLVYNYVRYRTANADLAEDLTAEAFLKAAHAFGRFDPVRAKFSTWVITIARNCIASYWRRAKLTGSIDDVAESDVAVEDSYPALNDDEQRVQQLLSVLDDDERELVFLKYYEGKRNVDIAAELNLNASTVSTKLARALAKMRAVAERGQ